MNFASFPQVPEVSRQPSSEPWPICDRKRAETLHVSDPQLASVSAWKDEDFFASWVLWNNSHARGRRVEPAGSVCGLDMGWEPGFSEVNFG